MSAAMVLAFSLFGPPQSEVAGASEAVLSKVTAKDISKVKHKTYTAKELRAKYIAASQASARFIKPKPEDVVVDLVTVYGEIDHVKRMAPSEKKKMRTHIEVRLTKLRSQMLRENRERERFIAKERRRRKSSRSRTTKPTDQQKLNATAAEIASAKELVELIQGTISPATWDVNGGEGSIRYFPLLKVLVVRAPGEVHHRIGGVLQANR